MEDLPKMNYGVLKPMSDNFDSYTLFTFENSITRRSKLKYRHTWVVIEIYFRQCGLSTCKYMIRRQISIVWMWFDRFFVNLNESRGDGFVHDDTHKSTGPKKKKKKKKKKEGIRSYRREEAEELLEDI